MAEQTDPLTFADADGLEFRPQFDGAAIREFKAATGVNLNRLVERGAEAVCRRLLSRPDRLGEFLWAACRHRAAELGLTPERFALGVCVVPVLEQAIRAAFLALVEAFPRSRLAAELGPGLVLTAAAEMFWRGLLSGTTGSQEG